MIYKLENNNFIGGDVEVLFVQFNLFDYTSTHLKHSHKKQKDSLETRAVLLILRLNLEYLGWPYRDYIKIAKNGDFC